MGLLMEVRLSCYLVWLSNDSKTRLQDSRTVTQPLLLYDDYDTK